MNLGRCLLVAAALVLGFSDEVKGTTVRIENTTGKITARVARTTRITAKQFCAQRNIQPGDVAITRQNGLILVRATPPDNVPIDLEVEIPYRLDLQASTTTGAISVSGLLPHVALRTETGDVTLAMPWEATKLVAETAQAPKTLQLPDGLKFSRQEVQQQWQLTDKLPDMRITYGQVELKAGALQSLTLENITIPEDSPDKLPSQARAIVDELLPKKSGKSAVPQTGGATSDEPAETAAGAEMPVFRSSVRLVNLTAAITDGQGHPIKDLKPEDFEVLENKVPQKVTFAGSEEVPFNLALLLDLSGSTQRDRAAMKEAAKRFLDIARPQDKIAAYALANNLFQVISSLTTDRKLVAEIIEALPEISGGSPLYDTIVLSYAQEFRRLPSERNALIVISDGVDNQLDGIGAASEVSFDKLLRASEGMNMMIYPIFLDPFTRVPPPNRVKRARTRMEDLATATGGRLFPAQSVHDLEPVYPQVAEELRSVYTIAYYPDNQAFDGAWRPVEIKVKRSGVKVRSRTGYFAR